MSINPIDIYGLAEKLVSDDEASNRSAVSRAYYGAYHKVRISLNELPNFSGSQHAGLIDYLKRPSVFDDKEKKLIARRISILLNTIRVKRAMADYDLNDDVDKIFTCNVIEEAKNIIELSEKLMK